MNEAQGRARLDSLLRGPLVLERGSASIGRLVLADYRLQGELEGRWSELVLSDEPRARAIELVLRRGELFSERERRVSLTRVELAGAELGSEGFRLRLYVDELRTLSVPSFAARAAELALLPSGGANGPRVELRIAEIQTALRGTTLRTALSGSARLERVALSSGRIVLGAGELSAPEVELEDQFLTADVELAWARFSPRRGLTFSAAARVSGEDAALLLDLMNASEALRMTLSVLEDEPFSLAAELIRRPRRWRLERMGLEAGPVTATGELSLGPGRERRGNLTVQYGGFPILVRVRESGTDIDFGAGR